MKSVKLIENNIEKILEEFIGDSQKLRNFYMKVSNSLTPEEREYLKRMITTKNCSNCSNGTCRVENEEKLNSDDNCIGWDNKEMIGRAKILMK